MSEKVQKFKERTNEMVGHVQKFNDVLKEIGDFEQWVKVMEKDLGGVVEALEIINDDGNR